MFANLTTQLDTILDQLELVVEKNTPRLISPLLAVHPPGLRDAHARFLETRQDDMNVALTAVLSIETRVTAIRTKIQRHQRACAFARTPVSALPDELLCIIFSFAVHDNVTTTEWRPRAPSPLSVAIALSKVCRKWHMMATNLRALWTSLHLSEDDLQRADNIIRRSGPEPIEVKIIKGQFLPSDYLATEFQQRLKILSVPCHTDVQEALTRCLKPKATSYESTALDSLTLVQQPLGWTQHQLFRKPYKFKFPKLRALRLDGVPVFYGFQAKHLTTLEILNLSSPETPWGDSFCLFLNEHTGLEKLVLDKVDAYDDSQPLPSIAMLEALRHLEIRNVSGPCLAALLSCFSAPHLERFVVLNPEECGDFEEAEDDHREIEIGWAMEMRENVRRKLERLVSAQTIVIQLLCCHLTLGSP